MRDGTITILPPRARLDDTYYYQPAAYPRRVRAVGQRSGVEIFRILGFLGWIQKKWR